MDMTLEYTDGLQYSEEIKNAVRYGYMYRKESEQQKASVRFCLQEPSELLLWLCGVILSGVTWDVIKGLAIKTFKAITQNGQNIDKRTKNIFSDESELKVFYDYTIEYHEHRMNITEDQRKYIKEEIYADIVAKKESEIIEREGRRATMQELVTIFKEALAISEEHTRKK